MTYSLTDLSRVAGVTPRTVRYYIGQGLLPSPGAGPSARYGETHLTRLRVIRRLQREHLPLAEIRRRLDELSEGEIMALSESPHPTSEAVGADSAADYIRRLVSQPGLPARAPVPASASLGSPAPAEPFTLAEAMPPAGMPPAAMPSLAATTAAASLAPAPPLAEPGRSTWERHTLTSDVELHVRRPLDRATSKNVDRLIRIARELLADEP